MERRKLSKEEVETKLADLKNWKFKGDKLRKKYKFENFAAALAFVNKVGAIAEETDHHPDIKFGWGYANIKSTTHDRDGVTDVDLALAQKIDGIE